MNYEFAASNEEVLSINGINHIRVKEPYYNDRKGVIYGICPH